jgi:hypothetical protein
MAVNQREGEIDNSSFFDFEIFPMPTRRGASSGTFLEISAFNGIKKAPAGGARAFRLH